MTPTFKWTCSFMGCVDYLVSDETGQYRIEERRRTSDYERSISNYKTDEAWNRNVVAAIGTIRRSCEVDKPIPPSTVEAFNRWRAEKHAADIANLRAQPERYGEIRDEDFPAPPVVKGARYDHDAKSIVLT